MTLLGCALASADGVGDAAKAILSANETAIVTVRIVVNERFIFESFEDETEYVEESSGFVIDDDGTVVTSLAATDPEVFYKDFFDDNDGMDIRTEISSLSILYHDGSEVEAEVALRDRDLDQIFLRPTRDDRVETGRVDLARTGTAEVFDKVVMLQRYDHTMKRNCGGVVVRIQTLVERPRRFYRLGAETSALGAPVFTLDGRCLGMITLRKLDKSVGGERGMWSNIDDFNVVVLATEDIAEAAKQLPAP